MHVCPTHRAGKRVIIEMEDLTHAMVRPCLMDIKMGARTFIEEEASATSLRSDLLEKMLKVDASAATEEEKKAGGITKMRYLQVRRPLFSPSPARLDCPAAYSRSDSSASARHRPRR